MRSARPGSLYQGIVRKALQSIGTGELITPDKVNVSVVSEFVQRVAARPIAVGEVITPVNYLTRRELNIIHALKLSTSLRSIAKINGLTAGTVKT